MQFGAAQQTTRFLQSEPPVQAAERTLAREPVDRTPIGLAGIEPGTAQRILGHETYWRAKIKSQVALWEGRRVDESTGEAAD